MRICSLLYVSLHLSKFNNNSSEVSLISILNKSTVDVPNFAQGTYTTTTLFIFYCVERFLHNYT